MDGVMINVEWFLSNKTDLGDLFDYDSVALLILDIFLYIKLFIHAARETNTDGFVIIFFRLFAVNFASHSNS